MANELESRIRNRKIATIVGGIVVLGIGLYSHFTSNWVKEIPFPNERGNGWRIIKVYEICKPLKDAGLQQPCPSIVMEHYYVSAIIICFTLSLIGLIASYMTDFSSSQMSVDLGFHVVAALALGVAGILYIVSAMQINAIFEEYNREWRWIEKLVAGVLTIILALDYGYVAKVIGTARS